MLLGEELILLLLDDDTGAWLVPRKAVRRSVRVALVVELLAQRAIALGDDGRLVAGLAAATGGDPVLDSAARQVVGHRPQELARPDRRELGLLLGRLRGAGVLRRGHLGRRHLPRDPHPESAVRARLLEALTVQQRPDRHTALLAALAYELNLLPQLFPQHADLPGLVRRAASVAAQLREDAHYFPTTLGQDAATATGKSRLDDVGDAFAATGDALAVLDVMVQGGRLLLVPARAVLRLLDGLP